MNSSTIEKEWLGAAATTKGLAEHLVGRIHHGPVVIVSARPRVLLSVLRKRWVQQIRKLEWRRAETLDAAQVRDMTNAIDQMQTLPFTQNWPPDDQSRKVYITTKDQLLSWAPDCPTLYVTCGVDPEELQLITALMPPKSLVVMCPLVTINQ